MPHITMRLAIVKYAMLVVGQIKGAVIVKIAKLESILVTIEVSLVYMLVMMPVYHAYKVGGAQVVPKNVLLRLQVHF